VYVSSLTSTYISVLFTSFSSFVTCFLSNSVHFTTCEDFIPNECWVVSWFLKRLYFQSTKQSVVYRKVFICIALVQRRYINAICSLGHVKNITDIVDLQYALQYVWSSGGESRIAIDMKFIQSMKFETTNIDWRRPHNGELPGSYCSCDFARMIKWTQTYHEWGKGQIQTNFSSENFTVRDHFRMSKYLKMYNI
jgi:hypothetical protein